jgi:chromosome segregation ATPase
MALDKMEALEKRVRGLVDLIQSLKKANATLEGELRTAQGRLMKQEDQHRRWKEERSDIKSRIEKVLDDVETLECLDGAESEES